MWSLVISYSSWRDPMLVAPLTQIPIQTQIQTYLLSVNEENFSAAFLLFVSFSSFSLYDALFFLPCSHHHVVLFTPHGKNSINMESMLQSAKCTRSLILALTLVKQGYRWTLTCNWIFCWFFIITITRLKVGCVSFFHTGVKYNTFNGLIVHACLF